jgi:hypothetical protein
MDIMVVSSVDKPNAQLHMVAITISSMNPINFSNGEIVSIFLRIRPNSPPISENTVVANNLCMEQIKGEDRLDMDQSEYTPLQSIPDPIFYYDVYFVVGDLSGNGSINSNDHVYYLAILQNNSSYTENNISVLTSSDAPGLFVSDAIIGNQIIFEAGDVNSDGVINQQDANLIVQYCQDDLLGILTGNEYIGSEWIARFQITPGSTSSPVLYAIIPA